MLAVCKRGIERDEQEAQLLVAAGAGQLLAEGRHRAAMRRLELCQCGAQRLQLLQCHLVGMAGVRSFEKGIRASRDLGWG